MSEYETQIRKLVPYVKYLQEQMALKDWSFTLELDMSDDEDAYAHIVSPDGRKQGIISLTKLFFEQDEEGQRHTLTHELTHAHTREVSTVTGSVRNLLGDIAYPAFEKNMDNAIELAVDGIADGWAKMLPTFSEWNMRQNR